MTIAQLLMEEARGSDWNPTWVKAIHEAAIIILNTTKVHPDILRELPTELWEKPTVIVGFVDHSTLVFRDKEVRVVDISDQPHVWEALSTTIKATVAYDELASPAQKENSE